MRAQRVVLAIGLIGVLCTAASARALHAQQGSAKPDSAAMYNEATRLVEQAQQVLKSPSADSQRKGLGLLLKAEPLVRNAGATADLMVVQYSIARQYSVLGRVDSAEHYFGLSLALARQVGNQNLELTILLRRGLTRDRQGRSDSALADFLQAHDLSLALGEHSNDAILHLGLGKSYLALSRLDSAIAHFRAVLVASGTTVTSLDSGEAYNGAGHAFATNGQADSALANYRRSLAVRRSLGAGIPEAESLRNIGLVYSNIAQPDSALAYYREALVIQRREANRPGEAGLLQNIGSIEFTYGALDSALAYDRLALPIYREIGDRSGEGKALHSIGLAYFRAGAPDSAMKYYRTALDVSRAEGDQRAVAAELDNIGRAMSRAGAQDSALAYSRQSLRVAESMSDRPGEVISLEHMGEYFRDLGRLDSASTYLERATILGSSMSRATGSDFNQLHYNEQAINVYALWSLVMFDRVYKGDTLGGLPAALAVSERGRSQALLNLMGRTRQFTAGADLGAEGRALAKGALAHANGALVYSFEADTLLVWLILPDQKYANVQYAPTAELDTLLAGLRYGIAQEDAIAERGGRITRGGSQLLDPLDQKLLTPAVKARATADKGLAVRRELSRLLFPPTIAAHLPASGELLIIPQGGLGLLPFGLLPIGSDSTLLGDRFAIRYGPSLTAVAEAEARPGLAPGSDRAKQLAPALIVGDPAMPAPFALDGEHYSFDPLPSARLEGKAVADSLGAQWLSGTQASEAAVRAAIPDARLVHLATHGLVYSSDAHTRLSFVALAPDATHDGHLSVAKIVDSLTFKAELVVLSACQTAVGNVTSAEGTLGLQRAVLAKGARSVLVSLWNVPDESTLFLIERFYHHWLHDPGAPSKSEALRLAQADVRAEAARTAAHRDWADPFYWAAFQLVGAP